MSNIYLEKIAHWASYLVNGEAKVGKNLARVGHAREGVAKQGRKYLNQFTSGASSQKGHAKKLSAVGDRKRAVDKIARNIIDDHRKANAIKGVAKGTAAGIGAGAAAVGAHKLFKSKTDK